MPLYGSKEGSALGETPLHSSSCLGWVRSPLISSSLYFQGPGRFFVRPRAIFARELIVHLSFSKDLGDLGTLTRHSGISKYASPPSSPRHPLTPPPTICFLRFCFACPRKRIPRSPKSAFASGSSVSEKRGDAPDSRPSGRTRSPPKSLRR